MHEKLVNVLIVEDYFADSYYLRELLSTDESCVSYSFEVVPSLVDCKRVFETIAVDIIFLDLGLPDSDGLDTLFAVGHLAGHIPIVVVTGFEETTTLDKIRELGFDVLQKGEFKAKHLHEALQRVLINAPGQTAPHRM